jgi:transcriptional regulator with XRE-family HTH domain
VYLVICVICKVQNVDLQVFSTASSVPAIMSATLIEREQRDFIERVLSRTGWTPTELARRAKLDHSTLSRFMAGNREGHALRHSTIRKIEVASGLNFAGHAASPASIKLPQQKTTHGFAESEATPISTSEPSGLSAFVKAALQGHNDADPWLLRSRALEGLGYRPGDVLIVKLGAIPRAGDVVCAQIYDWGKGGAETVFRLFQPPYLVAQSNDHSLLTPKLVDNSSVVIKGVVILQFRTRPEA